MYESRDRGGTGRSDELLDRGPAGSPAGGSRGRCGTGRTGRLPSYTSAIDAGGGLSRDSRDLIAAAVVLGIPHPPGYPLDTILTHFAALAPVGSPAVGANMLAAALSAVAVAVAALAIGRLGSRTGLPRHRALLCLAAAMVTGALLLAFCTPFWAYSLGAEVFRSTMPWRPACWPPDSSGQCARPGCSRPRVVFCLGWAWRTSRRSSS